MTTTAAASDKMQRVCRAKFAVEEGERTVVARISTIDPDREGDVMLPSGVDLTDFKKNPIVLFSHGRDPRVGTLPVGTTSSIRKETDGIVAKVRFAERPQSHAPGAEWVPDTLLSLFQQKVLRAFSIGWTPIDMRPADERDRRRFGDKARRIVTKWALHEFSVVPIGMNQNALAMAVSKGLEIGPFVRETWSYKLAPMLAPPLPTLTKLRYTPPPTPKRLRVG